MRTFGIFSILLALLLSGLPAQDSPPITPEKMSQSELLAKSLQLTQEELALSRIAVRQAHSEKVKAFAQRAVAREDEIDKKLTPLAAAAGVSEPKKVSEPMQQRLDVIEKLRGEAFDPDYLKLLLDFHRLHIRIYEQLAKRVADQKLRDFAREAGVSKQANLKVVIELASPLIPIHQ